MIPEQRSKIIQEYYPLLDSEAKDIIGRTGTEYYLTKLKFDYGVPFAFKTNIEKQLNNTSFFSVGYNNQETSNNVNLSHVNEKLNDHFENQLEPVQSELVVDYLYRIVELTSRNNMPLILVNPPKHELYINAVPKAVVERFNEQMAKLVKLNSHMRIYDFSCSFTDIDLFRDTDHVNATGAKFFSKKLDSCLVADF